jgi:hypothetical protein
MLKDVLVQNILQVKLKIDKALVESQAARELIRDLVQKRPYKRPSLVQVISNEWVNLNADKDESYVKFFCRD